MDLEPAPQRPVATPNGSAVPKLRANRGNAPPLTCTRIRCPACTRYAVG